MLIVFPLGLLTVAAIFDTIYISTHNGHLADLSYWMIASGIIGGLIAAVFGLIDWLGIPGRHTREVHRAHPRPLKRRRSDFVHRQLVMRRPNPAALGMTAMMLGWIGIVIALFAGWLGDKLVYRLNVGVDRGGNLDAPNSLSGRPAIGGLGRRSTRGVIRAC